MRIAIASGKGGTGKTTVATSLAHSLAGEWEPDLPAPTRPLFLDCDVEAPNAHLFLKPVFNERFEVGILIPQVDPALCTACGACAQVCQYNAIAVLGKKTLVFPQLCHGCGSCVHVCAPGAISESLNPIGVLERGVTPAGIQFGRGVLNIGEPMATPVIRQLKRWAAPDPDQVVILDASPGASCPVVESIKGADFVILVSEPTPFGFHDLKLAVEVTRELQVPAGVILNRCGTGPQDDDYRKMVETYCQEHGLPILLRIPFEREIAAGVAQGMTLPEIHPEYGDLFRQLFAGLKVLSARPSSEVSL